MPPRVDLVALHAQEYGAGRVPRVVATSPARYLSLDGEGDVAGEEFLEQAMALHRVLRGIRARVRHSSGKDFALPPLEALVGAPRSGGAVPPAAPAPWKLLLRVPAFVRASDLAGATEALDGELDGRRPARIEEIQEGRCIQALHLGPFETVGTTVDRLRRSAADAGLEVRGRLHEVWLSAPGRTSPERRRTVVRLPVKAR